MELVILAPENELGGIPLFCVLEEFAWDYSQLLRKVYYNFWLGPYRQGWGIGRKMEQVGEKQKERVRKIGRNTTGGAGTIPSVAYL